MTATIINQQHPDIPPIAPGAAALLQACQALLHERSWRPGPTVSKTPTFLMAPHLTSPQQITNDEPSVPFTYCTGLTQSPLCL
ncbi:hypothetical protein VTJ04DRAFT_5569 [Mycothermus thermophilus]|uniref:uncharacterized protein n=1 Tax=Humicola insolens TaxID=85995 RepID=UPI003744B055